MTSAAFNVSSLNYQTIKPISDPARKIEPEASPVQKEVKLAPKDKLSGGTQKGHLPGIGVKFDPDPVAIVNGIGMGAAFGLGLGGISSAIGSVFGATNPGKIFKIAGAAGFALGAVVGYNTAGI